MKKIFLPNSFRSIATMFAVGLAFAACSSDPEIDKAIEPVQVVEEEPAVVEPAEPAKPKYIMTVVASRGEDAVTRALSVAGEGEGMYVTSTWEETDVVTVYADNTVYGTLNPTEISDDGTQATFMGVLDVLPAENAVLTLTYSGNDYSAQDGTLDGIDATCNYSVAENVEIAEIVKEIVEDQEVVTIKTTDANFVNQQFIAEFTLLTQDRSTSVATTELTIIAGGQTITVTPASATDKLYVAIPDFTGSISLTAKAAGTTLFENSVVNYTFSIPSISDDEFENSTFYTIGVGLKKDLELGDPYYSDGTYAVNNKHAEGAEPIGVVVYIDDPSTEDDNAITAYEDGEFGTEGATYTNVQGQALVMALNDTERQNIHWDDINKKALRTVEVKNPGAAYNDFRGYWKTHTIQHVQGKVQGHDITEDDFFAVHDALTYEPEAPDGTSGWFLPSIGEWLAVLYGLGGADLSDWPTNGEIGTAVDLDTAVINRLDAALTTAGGISFISNEHADHFWTSSEYDDDEVLIIDFRTAGKFIVNTSQKNKGNNAELEDVRAFLIF